MFLQVSTIPLVPNITQNHNFNDGVFLLKQASRSSVHRIRLDGLAFVCYPGVGINEMHIVYEMTIPLVPNAR